MRGSAHRRTSAGDSAGTRIARAMPVQITDNHLEESFFSAGDNLAAATTQFDLVATTVEDRRRGLKALIVTGAILLFAFVLLSLLLPAPASHSAHEQREPGGAQL